MYTIPILFIIGVVQCQYFDSPSEGLSMPLDNDTSSGSLTADRDAPFRIFGFRQHFINNRPYRLPPFLKNASVETRKSFREIFFNRSLTLSEKKTKIDRLMEQESENVKAGFEIFKKTMKERKERMEQEHKEAISRLSQEAQEADAKIINLFKNETMTYAERRQKMKQIFENLSDQVRTELKSLRPRKRFEGSFGKCCKENTKEMSTKNSSN
ncbi:unnamed protein product [Enterobius vermicularis]|uniref:DUF148 domain-containing protein n=1 Tax=Enterobius vermicularis TaxID=51028 RepID=A0A0N4UYB0_ENTVE|nr:unnamed protein product [Enterobius vermicularis]